MIYFDNSATTIHKPKKVAHAMYNAINSKTLGNPSRGGHRAAQTALRELFKTREIIAHFFGAINPLQVGLTQNATAGLNAVLKGLLKKGDHVITSMYEHNSVLRPLYQILDLEISFISIERITGSLAYDTVEQLIKKNTRAIVVTHASNVTGAITNLHFLHELCLRYGLILIIDAAQTAGLFPLNISEFQNTIVCFTGHKSLYGPQGTGGIIVQGDIQFIPLLSGGSGIHSFNTKHPHTLPDVFEAGTVNVPSFIGLRTGIEFIQKTGIENIRKKGEKLRLQFIHGLKKYPNTKIYGWNELSNTSYVPIVSFNLQGIHSSELAFRLDDEFNIAMRSGAHCAPKTHQFFNTEQDGMLRASFSYFNTTKEVHKTLQAIEHILKN